MRPESAQGPMPEVQELGNHMGAGFHSQGSWDHQRIGCVETGLSGRAQK